MLFTLGITIFVAAVVCVVVLSVAMKAERQRDEEFYSLAGKYLGLKPHLVVGSTKERLETWLYLEGALNRLKFPSNRDRFFEKNPGLTPKASIERLTRAHYFELLESYQTDAFALLDLRDLISQRTRLWDGVEYRVPLTWPDDWYDCVARLVERPDRQWFPNEDFAIPFVQLIGRAEEAIRNINLGEALVCLMIFRQREAYPGQLTARTKPLENAIESIRRDRGITPRV